MKTLSTLTLVLLLASFTCDASRMRFATEKLPLDSYQVYAIPPAHGGRRMAYVMDPEEYMYHVEVGHVIGQDHGKVVGIDADGVDLVELVQDEKGNWVERTRRMKLPAGKLRH